MITLEQIRLLEGKITRAIDLIRVLKDENTTLRKGLESAQRRMRELETLVDGFKTDQKEIESVIVRTLHNLDELEETAATPGGISAATPGGISPAAAGGDAPASRGSGVHAGAGGGAFPGGGVPAAPPAGTQSMAGGIPASSGGTASSRRAEARTVEPSGAPPQKDEPPAPKEELDIF